MKYELYHDESLEGGFWHGMLLVPEDLKDILVSSLREVRQHLGYDDSIGIKKVKKPGIIYDCADSWMQIGVASLRSRTKGMPYPIYLGKRDKGTKEYAFFDDKCFGAKFILFCERDKHIQMVGHQDHASKVETTFRMGLKGGLHYLGNEEDPIDIVRMHFDGHEHYGRHLNINRIIGRLNGLRKYCSIAKRSDLIDDRTSDHRRADCQDYTDCQFLQLADLLIGCSRTLLGEGTRKIHDQLAQPLGHLLTRYREGYARMQNSRWLNSFCMSQCYLDSGQWIFETFEYEDSSTQQMMLPL